MAASSPDRSKSTSGWRRRWLAILVSLSMVAAAALFYVGVRRPSLTPDDSPAADPRREYQGPFQNVDPAVGYVLEARCAECHHDIATAYAEHAMGRSLYPARTPPALPTDRDHHNPFRALGSSFSVEHAGPKTVHRRVLLGKDGTPLIEQEWQVDYVIGSGGRGHSFLTDRDGFLQQTPVSWYTQKQRWDLSPGFDAVQAPGRAVLPDCLFCHANRARHVKGSVARYESTPFDGHAIGCQRCHGPGELHVAGRAPTSDGVDRTIVNPRHLTPALRDAICEQCHLQGDARVPHRGLDLGDFRPGLPAERFWTVLLRGPAAGKGPKAISHVEQMQASRCYEQGQGQDRLSCVSCHDPHRRIAGAERVDFYRERCLACHAGRGCAAPPPARQAQRDSCIDCHMPRYGASDIPHTASTDHRILRHGGAVTQPRSPRPSGLPLIAYYEGRDGVRRDQEDRARALALVRLGQDGADFALKSMPHALGLLQRALERAPRDLMVLEARGYALGWHNRPAEALAAFENVLAVAPGRESSLRGAAAMADAAGKAELALSYWRAAVGASPVAPGYRGGLALALMRAGAWDDAQRAADAWVRLDPFNPEARTARFTCFLERGAVEEAGLEFARLEALEPANLEELRIRLDRKRRSPTQK